MEFVGLLIYLCNFHTLLNKVVTGQFVAGKRGYVSLPIAYLILNTYPALTPEKEPLGWNTRMKVAVGAARGLEYLHVKANPPVIYRDLKSANILLDDDFNPKLSDFGLAKLGPVGDNTHVSTRVMGTYGYCAPEYAKSGKLTLKSDVFSFGVLLLELITGRKSIDNSRAQGERDLVLWVSSLFYIGVIACFQYVSRSQNI